jgi:hypothetical protein
MPLLQVLMFLMVVGVLLWLVNNFLPMAIKSDPGRRHGHRRGVVAHEYFWPLAFPLPDAHRRLATRLSWAAVIALKPSPSEWCRDDSNRAPPSLPDGSRLARSREYCLGLPKAGRTQALTSVGLRLFASC